MSCQSVYPMCVPARSRSPAISVTRPVVFALLICRSRGSKVEGRHAISAGQIVRPMPCELRHRWGPSTDTYPMMRRQADHMPETSRGDHFSCSLSAVLLARVNAFGGPDAVTDVLRLAGSRRTLEYLLDITNWIAYDEAVALWQAGARVTGHPNFARPVGEDAARRLAGSQVAAVLRSLGSPENVYRAIATGGTKFSSVTKLEATDAGAGYADVVAVAAEGFPRSVEHCAWTCGLLSCTTNLFGLPPATVSHEECQAMGAERCVYHVSWDDGEGGTDADSSEPVTALQHQLD